MHLVGQRALPRVYAILDGDALRRHGVDLLAAAASLRDAGATLVQYREKSMSRDAVRTRALALAEVFAGSALLLLNDYVDLVSACGFDGVHLGQGDVPVREARALLGRSAVIGLSTHGPEQVRAADAEEIDYVAIGPVFGTQSKAVAEPAVGIEGVRAARALTSKPLVAIGGISAESAPAVVQAGADAVATIGELMGRGADLGSRWTALSHVLRHAGA